MQRPKAYALAIELTAYCNQKCGYCYNDWRGDPQATGSLPTDALLEILDRALTEVDFDHVTLTGGEPFARADLFDFLSLIERHDKRALIISNGGLITEALAERLAQHRPLFVQITLNGDHRELHEEHVGKDCFEKTLGGIRALTSRGVPVMGCVVITRKNAARVGAILDLFETLGVRHVALSRFSPAGFGASQAALLLPSRTELVSALEAAEARGQKGFVLQSTMPIPPCVVDVADFPSLRFSSCPIGTEMQEFALGPDGKLRHCTLHVGELGDAKTSSMARLITSPEVGVYRDVTPEFCEPCSMRSSCLGGCGAAAMAVLGPRGLDPFVAQHVDDAFAEKLALARSETSPFVPANRLRRRSLPS